MIASYFSFELSYLYQKEITNYLLLVFEVHVNIYLVILFLLTQFSHQVEILIIHNLLTAQNIYLYLLE